MCADRLRNPLGGGGGGGGGRVDRKTLGHDLFTAPCEEHVDKTTGQCTRNDLTSRHAANMASPCFATRLPHYTAGVCASLLF